MASVNGRFVVRLRTSICSRKSARLRASISEPLPSNAMAALAGVFRSQCCSA